MRLKKDGTPWNYANRRPRENKALPQKVDVVCEEPFSIASVRIAEQLHAMYEDYILPEELHYAHDFIDPKHKKLLPMVMKTMAMLEKQNVKVA